MFPILSAPRLRLRLDLVRARLEQASGWMRRCGAGFAMALPVGLCAALPSIARDLPDFADLVEKAGPAVVNIRTQRSAESARVPQGRGRSPAMREEAEAVREEGSGFILSGDGHVLTNAHVVAGATEVRVTLTDKREYKARLIGADERTDIALLKVDASGLPFLRIGDVSRLRVGEWVLAIGSPFGLSNSVTAGIVSGKQRETGSDIAFLQTDVAVNPGNSGGPLMNVQGEVVGINSQILSPVGSFIGISSAIPIDEAMRVVEQLKSNGHVVRAYLGIQPVDVPREMADELGLLRAGAQGALVRQVIRGGPADKAGVQPGDVVLALAGRPVEGALELRRRIAAMKPGSTVSLQISRRGKPLELKVALVESSAPTAASAPRERAAELDARPSSSAASWGLSVGPLSEGERHAARAAGGVKVTGATGSAQAAGLREGDVIVAIGESDVQDLRQFNAVIAKRSLRQPLPLTVLRDDWAQFLRLPPQAR